jgi:tetratricopeptide (TPR) repeat protein
MRYVVSLFLNVVLWSVCLSVYVSVCVGAASASSVADIDTALREGQYQSAYEQGLALDNAQGMVLAVEALNAQLLLGGQDDPSKLAKRALKLAKRARALDPEDKEAGVQYAIAYGFYGRHASAFKAWRKKLPQKIKAAIEDAHDRNASDARVEALRGAWHLSLLYRAGSWNVGKRYGASIAVGQKHFDTALALKPDDILINSNYGLMLYVLGPEQYKARTQYLLETAVATQPLNAVERDVQTRMAAILTTMKTNPAEALHAAENFVRGE